MVPSWGFLYLRSQASLLACSPTFPHGGINLDNSWQKFIHLIHILCEKKQSLECSKSSKTVFQTNAIGIKAITIGEKVWTKWRFIANRQGEGVDGKLLRGTWLGVKKWGVGERRGIRWTDLAGSFAKLGSAGPRCGPRMRPCWKKGSGETA